ncbi:MAG: ribosomal RNA small subunit methyltransferase A [Planctomycetota bacterium]|nr:MAG: ribosomal RNA small subunit methyltransferase A [Planctomycetota bacterium]
MQRLAEIRAALASHGIRPHKRMGQNFLVDTNMLRAIVRDAEVDLGDCVLEVGPGSAGLTQALADEAGLVVALELDRGMFDVAREFLALRENVVLLQGDALTAEGRLHQALEGLLHAYLSHGLFHVEESDFERSVVPAARPPRLGRLKCVSNLPYNAAGPIIMALLESALPFERLVVMVQYEVGEKLCARPGNAAYGILSLLRAQFADARIIRKVPASVFWPRPTVASALVELRPARRPDSAAYARLRQLVHVFFTHRRKRAANALGNALGVNAKQAEAWIVAAGGNPGLRPDELDYAVLQKLADMGEVARRAHDIVHEADLRARLKAERAARRAGWRKPRSDEEE